MPFRIYMHKQWPFKICMRITSAFPTIAASSVLCLASAGGSDQYFGCLVQTQDLGRHVHQKPLLRRVALQRSWGAVRTMGRKKKSCFEMQMVSESVLSGRVKTNISYNASPTPAISVMSPKCTVQGCHGCRWDWTHCSGPTGMQGRKHPPPPCCCGYFTSYALA